MLFDTAITQITSHQVTVVPIVANAGAALLPMAVGMATTVVAVLLKPKELMRVLKSKPWILLLVVGFGLASWGTWNWVAAPPVQAVVADGVSVRGPGTDWTKVALAVIERDRLRPAVSNQVDHHMPADVAKPVSAPASATKTLNFRGDNSRCGYGGGVAPEKLVVTAAFNAEFEWFTSSPLVRDGRVYTASCYLDGITSHGTVYGLDARSAEKIWAVTSYRADGKEHQMRGFFSSPVLSPDGKRLVIGQGLHPDGNVHLICLDSATGATLWTVPTELHVESSPAIDGDLVVVGCGAIEDPQTHKPAPGANPGYVLAVRLSDGHVLWTHPVNDPESSPAIAHGMVFIGSGFNGNALVGLRLGSDEELQAKGLQREVWRVPTPHPATGTVTVVDDLVLVGCGNGDVVYAAKDPEGLVIAVEAISGQVRWRTDRTADGSVLAKADRAIQDAVLGAIAVRDGVAVCPVRNGEVVALNLADGSLKWRQKDPASRIHKRGTMVAGPSFAGGRIYAVTTNGFLGVIDATDGKVLEKLFINDQAGERSMTTSSPWVEDGTVWVGSETGGLKILSAKP